jgi:hypothetical protein
LEIRKNATGLTLMQYSYQRSCELMLEACTSHQHDVYPIKGRQSCVTLRYMENTFLTAKYMDVGWSFDSQSLLNAVFCFFSLKIELKTKRDSELYVQAVTSFIKYSSKILMYHIFQMVLAAYHGRHFFIPTQTCLP